MVYHGMKSAQEREAAHNAFLTGKANVVVATVAFGMGIDKPDIRKVIHWEAPKTSNGHVPVPLSCPLCSCGVPAGTHT